MANEVFLHEIPAPTYLTFIESQFGLSVHPTDDYHHWRDTKEEILAVRKLFDSVPSEHHKAILELMEHAKYFGALEEHETNSSDGAY